jgi:2-phospho-L-lactate guanylyltransferase
MGSAGRAYDEHVAYRGRVHPLARWTAVVPIKESAEAKQRLWEVTEWRPALAVAFASDVLTALLGSRLVHDTLLVGGAGLPPALLASPRVHRIADVRGLNPAVEAGIAAALQRSSRGIVVIPADLPSLSSGEVDALLAAAPGDGPAVLADADGDGTTALLLPSGVRFTPAFGAASFQRHVAAGARPVPGAFESVRRDVDTVAHLAAAQRLGVGPHTAALLPLIEELRATRP